MGAALDKMSIKPSELPGGADWLTSCAALNASQVALGLGSCDVAKGYGDIQVVFLLFVYAYILYTAANLISDGSEMLEWIGALRKLVGPIILPILGAVPDGAMVLFSGLGDNAQAQVSVGVGALAGSTIMLLTVPWFMAILGGLVDVVAEEDATSASPRPGLEQPLIADTQASAVTAKGLCCGSGLAGQYGGRSKLTLATRGISPLRACKAVCCMKGVQPKRKLLSSSIFMIVSCASYLLIQIPAFAVGSNGRKALDGGAHLDNLAVEEHAEHWIALAGAFLTAALFVAYLVYNVVVPDDDRDVAARLDQVSTGGGSFISVFRELLENESLDRDSAKLKLVRQSMRVYFERFETSGDGTLDNEEFEYLFADVTGVASFQSFSRFADIKQIAARAFREIDADSSGSLTFEEIWEARQILCGHHQTFAAKLAPRTMTNHILTVVGAKKSAIIIKSKAAALVAARKSASLTDVAPNVLEEGAADEGEGEEEEEEEEEDEDDMASYMTGGKLNVSKVLVDSFWQMGLGTALVLIFSDPMVGVLQECGDRLGISAFYVAFVMAPLASNASELIASFNASKKKTAPSITTSLQQLLGAAVMNNTFCLFIFFILIFWKRLAWTFAAETLVIIIIEIIMFFYSLKKIQYVNRSLPLRA